MYLPAKAEKEVSERSEEHESGSNMGMMIAIIAIADVGGAAYYYFKFIRGKKNKDEDLDFYDDEDYQEEPYVNEGTEPEVAEDDSNISAESEDEDKDAQRHENSPSLHGEGLRLSKNPWEVSEGPQPL